MEALAEIHPVIPPPSVRALLLQTGFLGRFSLGSSKHFLKFLNNFKNEKGRTASRWSVCLLVQIEQLSHLARSCFQVSWLKGLLQRPLELKKTLLVSLVQFGAGLRHE